MLICPHCGTANRLGSNFCNKCGTDLSEVLSPDAEIDDRSASVERAARRAAELLHQETEPSSDERQAADSMSTSEVGEGIEPSLEPLTPNEEEAEEAVSNDAGARRPIFDLGLASPDSGIPQRAEQPVSISTTDLSDLLAPMNILGGTDLPEESILQANVPVDRETRNWLQQLLSADTPIVAAAATETTRSANRWYTQSLRRSWIFLLMLAAVLLPVVFEWNGPVGEPHSWSGVKEAYALVETLPAGADVLLFWAYDPATAGEMDLVIEPLLAHLILREANLTFVSPMPLGPVTARRKVQATLDNANITGDPVRAAQRIAAFNVFLPGGSAVLPLLATGSVTPLDGGRHGVALLDEMARPRYAAPDLAVVVAADAEVVQQWLEMVQPINGVPTIAVTAAGADPVVRPYLDSMQLGGLVSGFDGAYHYRGQMERRLSAAESTAQQTQIVVQNWGLLAILALLLTGNLIGLLFRTGNDSA